MTNTPNQSRLLSFSPARERPTRTAGDDRVIAGADHHHGDHDDFGGLHRDLIATGAAMDRREDASALVYAESGYTGSTSNLAQVSLASDNVFSDGSALELATISGSVASGFTATLTVAV